MSNVQRTNHGGIVKDTALSIIALILLIYNYLITRSNQKLKTQIKEKEDEALSDKLKAIQEERDRARDRMRSLLEHYRGDGPSGDA